MVVLALLGHAAHIEMNGLPNGIAQTASTVSGNTALTRRAVATIDRVPPQGKAAYYLQTSVTHDGPSRSHATGGAVSRYVIEGVPLADGPMRDDPCGIFVLTAEGLRTNRTAAGTVLSGVDGCWSGTRLRHR
jgi:type IV pilus assembly protein PilE